jgi:tetratricopeptide (TPR) repeat protein
VNDLRMSRARLYVVIDAFESDLRSGIERYLLDHMPADEVFTPAELGRVSERRSPDVDGEGVSHVHYLDLGVALDVLLRHKERLPHELTLELRSPGSDLARLIPIRHRVMHGRPLLDEDPSNALRELSQLKSRHWGETKAVVKHLHDDAAWEPLVEKQGVPNERTLHNLPEVDYDETSFIGRKQEREKLLQALKRRRTPVTTLTGEGGIGKTALALDVAYQLLDSEENPYEAILWVSLKTEKLTAHGVEELRGAIRGIDNTVLALGQGLASNFSGSLSDLADALDGIEALVIIDNLESAHGEEIVQMYDALPESVTYLFTSRWGIGQLERTFPVPPLSTSEAILLLRKFAAARSQSNLSSLSQSAAENTVRSLRYSPLALRWFVLASEAGRVPLEALRDQSELLDFCVRNVVEALSADSRAVLTVLRSLDRSISFDEFAVLTEMTIDALRRATKELTRGSLVVVEAEAAGAVAGRLALTATARLFLAQPDATSDFLATVRRREREYRSLIEETNDADHRDNFSRIYARDATDRPSLYLLETALNFARSGNPMRARQNVERARSFSPEYPEIYRVSARLRAAEGQFEAAVAELQSGLIYASDPSLRARTLHDMGDISSRHLRDTQQGLVHAKAAHDASPCSDTALLVGKLLVWTSDYKGGHEYLQEAHDSAPRRRRLYISTVIVDSWARWAGAELRDHAFESALSKSATGFHLGRQLHEAHPHDRRLADAVAECCIIAIRAQGQVSDAVLTRQSAMLRSLAQFIVRTHTQISPMKARLLKDSLLSTRVRDSLGSETNLALEKARSALVSASARHSRADRLAKT